MEKETETAKWHLRKEVSITHLITTVFVIFAVMKFGYDMSESAAVLEEKVRQNTFLIAELKTDLKSDLKGIHGKLDRLIERGLVINN